MTRSITQGNSLFANKNKCRIHQVTNLGSVKIKDSKAMKPFQVEKTSHGIVLSSAVM